MAFPPPPPFPRGLGVPPGKKRTELRNVPRSLEIVSRMPKSCFEIRDFVVRFRFRGEKRSHEHLRVYRSVRQKKEWRRVILG